MIALASLLFKNWRLLATVVGIAVALGGVGGLLLKVRADGYAAGFDKAQQQCEADKAALEAANKKVTDEAAKKLSDLENQLQIKEGEVDDYIKILDQAADASPTAASCGLGADSVHRLSTIQ